MAHCFHDDSLIRKISRMAAEPAAAARPRSAAVKDSRLTYRACTVSYAQALQLSSPNQLVGQNDFDFLSDRSAALVHAAEQRVLQSGVPEITAGEVLSKRTAGRFFVRIPLKNPAGQVTGIEVFIVSSEDLHRSYQLLIDSELQWREVVQQAPFAVLIHHNFEPAYCNSSWTTILGDTKLVADDIRRLLPAGSDTAVKTIRSVVAGDQDVELQVVTSAVRLNGLDAQAVYCLPSASKSAVDAESTDHQSFVEKRHGHRRDLAPDNIEQNAIEEDFLNDIRQPLIVCDNWVPVQVNSAAKSLLSRGSNNRYQSIHKWFNDRDRASIEMLLSAQDRDDQFVNTRVEISGQPFSAHVSTIVTPGSSHVLVALQPLAQEQTDLELQIKKLTDFASSAGDFFWEMDASQRMTNVSVELQDFLGIRTKDLLNVTLETLVSRHVHEDDRAEWKVLMTDLKKRLPFRDREYKWQHKDGDKRVVRLSGVPVFGDRKTFTGYRGIGRDFTAQHNSASIVAYHASHDSLTGLVNRREFELRCNDAVHAGRSATDNQALCFIDLDNFKRVNDTGGHLAGDELLRQLSSLFSRLVRKSDVLARLGGDEFGLLIYDVDVHEALRLANQLRSEVASFQFLWEDKQYSVGASIGLVTIDDRWENRSALFSAADAACYQAKNQGRNRVAVFEESESARRDRHGEQHWEEYLKSAIGKKQINLAVQKIVSIEANETECSRIEILLRMKSQEGTLLMPGEVLPVAERFGLSTELDKVVIEQTLEWLSAQPHVTDSLDLCCINLSVAATVDEKFPDDLIRLIKKYRVDASVLCFEISESAVNTNLTAVARFMERLGDTGCQFAINDFSGGVTSFSCLKKLPVNFVKINGLFVKAILEDPIHYAMVKSINDVSHTLGKQTIAGPVENQAVLDKLQELAVDMAQGFYISAPEMIDF